jgi:hydroxymethylbilane synthase
VPIAAYARIESQVLVMEGLVGNLVGDIIIKERIEGRPADAESLGLALAERLLSRGAKKILDEVYGRSVPGIDGDLAS